MKQEETIQVFRNYFNYINRPGAADLLQWIDANGFFEAPASKRHHGANPGGLAEHSINVFRRLLKLNAEEEKRSFGGVAILTELRPSIIKPNFQN